MRTHSKKINTLLPNGGLARKFGFSFRPANSSCQSVDLHRSTRSLDSCSDSDAFGFYACRRLFFISSSVCLRSPNRRSRFFHINRAGISIQS